MNHFMMFAVGVAILLIFGSAAAALFLPASLARRFAWPLAPGVGAGICSLIFFVFRRPMFGIEFLLLGLLLYLVYKRKRFSDLVTGIVPRSFAGVLLCCAAVFLSGFFAWRVHGMPYGEWDAWAIWNTHARLLVSDGQDWIKDLQHTAHGDYPLLTPANTARLWRYAGDEVPDAGAVIGIMLFLSSLALLAAAVSELRDRSLSLLFGFTLIGTALFLDHATSQYADVPLSFFILAAITLICVYFQGREKGPGLLILAGFCAGCAGWTKNEGLLFITAICAAMLGFTAVERPRQWNRLVPFFASLAVPLVIILVFKIRVPVQNDLIEYQTRETAIHRLTDLSRYGFTLEYFLKTFWTFGRWSLTPFIPLLAFVILRGFDRQVLGDQGWRIGCVTVGTVLLGYFFVYINTPADLKWHLDASLDRLIMHLWPSFLLLLALSLRKSPSSTVS